MTRPLRTVPANSPESPLTPRQYALHLLRNGGRVVFADTVIAVLISTLNGHRFGQTFAYAQAIGLSTLVFVEIGAHLMLAHRSRLTRTWRGLAITVGACCLGFVTGTSIADLFYGGRTWQELPRHPMDVALDFAMAAIFSTVVVAWFYFHARSAEHRAERAAAENEATLARLVLLQSQLEPHMLFNTLANLRALIGAEPERAQEMLDRLIDFLRATLAASRSTAHPLKDEFARIDDYLALMRVRMGARLRTTSRLPPELASLPVPPLLLQPLVENAIKHGLEPQRGAGELAVSAELEGATLVLRVADSGRGLAAAAASPDASARGAGFGVAQVRERLHTLYGDAASFTLAPRPAGGTLAEIRLPAAPAGHAPLAATA